MSDYGFIESTGAELPVFLVGVDRLTEWLEGQPEHVRNWLEGRTATMKPGGFSRLPGADGRGSGLLWVMPKKPDIWSIAGLRSRLWDAGFVLDASASPDADMTDLCIGWALSTYRFGRYLKPDDKPKARLVWPESADRDRVAAFADAICFARDLINTPADDMGPSELEAAARGMAEKFGGTATSVVGDDLLAQNYPMIHAVGRASDDAPRLIDLTFGDPDAPKVTLVGKGVCFDTGGLDLKPASGMELMRKDMGGAATALGLAQLLAATGAPIRLRVLVPAVENAVAGNAYRPGDILSTRQGISVEIGNTDAEGRLVLGDALTLASEEKPDLLIDFATLTGAARVAVGTEIAAYFTRDDELGDEVTASGRAVGDDVWRLPLHQGYRHLMDSPFADINNAGTGGFAGATTAALFLKEFVADPDRWVHFDIMAWNNRVRPGRPKGGEPMGLRAMYHLIMERYG